MADIRAFTTRALALLEADAEAQNFFGGEIAWLKERLAIWERQEWRVALIGITSSGKSTLVNALLSDRLLPAKVRPTSNSLVVCRQGSPPRAVIHYRNRPYETVDEASLCSTLDRVTDEKTNPDNCLDVEEIELFWPSFRLGAGVALVDTPGLDAYQLERHEELTLQFLLPTVDAVCFLTTAKANADSRILQYLDIIASHGKPLVLVQNMIDSIVPKLGIGGRVERTVGDVAEDHVKRLRKLLSQSAVAIRNAPIIQVSALWALEGALEKSRIPELIEVLGKHLDSLKPRLVGGRFRQLLEHLSKIVRNEKAATSVPSSKIRMEEERQEIEAYRALLKKNKNTLSTSLNTLSARLDRDASNFQNQVKSLKPKDVEKAKNLEQDIENWCGQVPGLLGNLVKEFHESTISIGRDLNLRDEDFRFDLPRSPIIKRVSVPVVSKTKTTRYEKDGLIAWLARKTGLGGYEYYTEEWMEVNRQAFSAAVEDLTRSRCNWAASASSDVQENFSALCRTLEVELERRQNSLQAKLSSLMAAEQRLCIADSLATLCHEIEETIAHLPEAHEQCQSASRRNMDNVETVRMFPSFVLDMVKVAHEISMRRYPRLRDVMRNRVEQRRQSKVDSFLIWGFDADSMARFMSFFWRDVVPPDVLSGSGIRRVGTVHGPVAIILQNESDTDLLRQIREFSAGGAMVYLLLDAEQPGSTMNQLLRSGAVEVLRDAHGVILVIQEIRGLENAGQVAAGVRQMKTLADTFQLLVDGVLVNSGNDVATAVVDRLFLRGSDLNTIQDEQEWIADLGLGAQDYVARILRDWREESNSWEGKGC